MFENAAREFLRKPLIARISTLDTDGYPHTIPVWFYLDGDDIIVISERNTKKIKNVHANAKGSITIGGEPSESAYLIKGDMTIEEDPGFEWMKRVTHHYETPEQAEKDIAEWSKTDMVIIRIKPVRVIKVV